MDLKIARKVAVVTGAAHGIGAAVARRLAQEGCVVVVADIAGAAAERQAADIAGGAGETAGLQVDVTSAPSVAHMVEAVVSRFGGIDILVNNAGFTRDGRIARMSDEDWSAVLKVILDGTFLCSRAVVPLMAARGWGRIVNISSRAHLGNPGQVNYSAAKAGLLGFTRALALEEGRNGITVNAVAPGMVDTEALRAIPHYDNFIATAVKNTPVRRVGAVDDIADAVAFLASDLAGYITGEVLHATGGRY